MVPTEEQEQIKLAEYLDRHNYTWCHVPNGGFRNVVTGKRLKAQGVKPGVPDVLIFDPVKHVEGKSYVGIAIELKRQKGGQLSMHQKNWLNYLRQCGWYTVVCKGADQAIDLLLNFERHNIIVK